MPTMRIQCTRWRTQVLRQMLLRTGLPYHALERFPLVGCEHIEGFGSDQLAGGDAKIDPQKTMAALLSMVRLALAGAPQIRAVPLESLQPTNQPPRHTHLIRPCTHRAHAMHHPTATPHACTTPRPTPHATPHATPLLGASREHDAPRLR